MSSSRAPERRTVGRASGGAPARWHRAARKAAAPPRPAGQEGREEGGQAREEGGEGCEKSAPKISGEEGAERRREKERQEARRKRQEEHAKKGKKKAPPLSLSLQSYDSRAEGGRSTTAPAIPRWSPQRLDDCIELVQSSLTSLARTFTLRPSFSERCVAPAYGTRGRRGRHRRSCQLMANRVCGGSASGGDGRPRHSRWRRAPKPAAWWTRSLTATTSAAALNEGTVITTSRGSWRQP